MLITLLPWVECRGSIPVAVAMNASFLDYLLMFFSNVLIFPVTFFLLEFLYNDFFSKFSFFRKIVKRVRKRGEPKIRKYEYLGLTFFVAVPLPFTGMYSGAILSWILHLDFKKSFLYASIGELFAFLLVLLISNGLKLVLV